MGHIKGTYRKTWETAGMDETFHGKTNELKGELSSAMKMITKRQPPNAQLYSTIYIYMYVCMYVCMYVYTYIYI